MMHSCSRIVKEGTWIFGSCPSALCLHHLFVQCYDQIVEGLYAAGGHCHATLDAGLLKEQIPACIQDFFEKRLGSRCFGSTELEVLAATIEHLAHSEVVQRLGEAINALEKGR